MNLNDFCIHFAHPAYQLASRFAARNTGIEHFQTWTGDQTRQRMGESNVLVLSGFWNNALLDQAGALRFIQVCAAGFEQFDQSRIRAQGIRLAHGGGVNANAVSDHAMALILALNRQLHLARDNQHRHHWRGMISDRDRREDELPGKTILIVGLGRIGGRLARLARAFGMRVIAVKRDTREVPDGVDGLYPPQEFPGLLPQADIVVLCCPLTAETRHLIDAQALAAMQQSACLINVARGGCVDQQALIEALDAGAIAGAGIDVTSEEPLDPGSKLWDFDNLIVTPHSAGETRRYEDNVIDILLDNLTRLARGEPLLRNQIV